MIFTIDCKTYSDKNSFLKEMKKIIEEMFSLNYDSLIDGARSVEIPTKISIKNIDLYEDAKELKEILKIIQQENTLIEFTFS